MQVYGLESIRTRFDSCREIYGNWFSGSRILIQFGTLERIVITYQLLIQIIRPTVISKKISLLLYYLHVRCLNLVCLLTFQAKTRIKLNFLDNIAKYWELQVRNSKPHHFVILLFKLTFPDLCFKKHTNATMVSLL